MLLGISLGCWALGLLAYLLITVPIVRRMLLARLDAEVLTPDSWVLMGALAIATLAGGSLVLAAPAAPAFGWLPGMLGPAVVTLWALAGAWIPLLLAGEVRRARDRPRPDPRRRWSTVFPLGMYSAASSVLAVVLVRTGGSGTRLPVVLDTIAAAGFWIALAGWCLVAVDLGRRAAGGVH